MLKKTSMQYQNIPLYTSRQASNGFIGNYILVYITEFSGFGLPQKMLSYNS